MVEGLQPGKMGEGLQPGEEGLFGICKFRQANAWLHTTPDRGSLQSSMGTLVLHEGTQHWISDRAVKVGVAFSTYALTTQVSLLEQCKHSAGILQLGSCLPGVFCQSPIFSNKEPQLEWSAGKYLKYFMGALPPIFSTDLGVMILTNYSIHSVK